MKIINIKNFNFLQVFNFNFIFNIKNKVELNFVEKAAIYLDAFLK